MNLSGHITIISQPLSHTTDNPDNQSVFFPFQAFKMVKPPPYALFRIIPDRACIDQDGIGFLSPGGQGEILFTQNGSHHFTVGHIHLAAIRFYE